MARQGSDTSHLICAIVTPNYLSQFLILGRSLAIAIPSAVVRVLVLQDCNDVEFFQQGIDDYLVDAQSEADHRAITVDEVDWRGFDVDSAVLFYSTLEFATSVKPALMRSFLCQGWERVTYLDPDIQIFKDFTSVLDDDSDVSLTPHIFTDIPRDGSRPSSHDILQAGFYNLGFCSARFSALPFLDWWSERLQFDCLVDPTAGYFTDQRILDLAPLRARVQIVQEPGCNVAYWNLHEREVVLDRGEWKVTFDESTHPLYFFHFSGFRLHRSPSLSIHASRRVLGKSLPRAFAVQYDEMLQRGRTHHQDVEFTLGGATPHEPIPTEWHRCLREDADVHVSAGHTLREVREEIYGPRDPSKWSTCLSCGAEHLNFGARARSFLAGWACHPSLEGVPNAISAFFRTSHHEFGVTPMAQLSWALENFQNRAQGNGRLAVEVMDAAAESLRKTVDLRLVGYFTYSAGIGQVARWTLQTLENADIYPALDRVFVENDSHEYLSKLLQRNNPLAAANASVLCFINADQWNNHVTSVARVDPTIQIVEAVWAWELEYIPSRMYDLTSSGEIDRVHALSHWSERAMANVLPIPVDRYAPFDLSLVDLLATPPGEQHGAIRPAPYILTTFDAKSLLSRKNPEGVLNIWQRVQADYPDHKLVVKSTNLREMSPPELLELIDTTDRTELIDEYLTDSDYFELLGNCEVFLSLHRSEGMGLTPIEAALCGLPVVYTDYGGLSEFLEKGFYPVSYQMTQVGKSSHELGPYDSLAYWAEPDLDDAERQLRRALAGRTNGTTASLLELDRKRLEENLVAAQTEVVSSSLRLMESAQGGGGPSRDRLIQRLRAPLIELEEQLNPPKVNPIYFRLVAVLYRIYRLLPAKVRLQFNLALKLLRSAQIDSTPQ